MSSTSTEPVVVTTGRPVAFSINDHALATRHLGWGLWQALGAGALALTALSAQPALLIGLGTGLGAAATAPRRPLAALSVLGATTGATLLVPSPIVAGLVAGAGAAWLAGRDRWQSINGALAGAVGAGVGWMIAASLPIDALGVSLWWTAASFATGIGAGLSLWAARVGWSSTQRIPSKRRIRKTLADRYVPPCLRAWELDRMLARQCPDRQTRDGLGEVAAWVYKLSWTLHSLDRELDGISEASLLERIEQTTAQAEATDDDFTRERKLATAEHLTQLLRHRTELGREHGRTEALLQYAIAFLEEARAGLALSRMKPGDGTPARLQDVLDRLRTHAQETDLRRRTERDLALVG